MRKTARESVTAMKKLLILAISLLPMQALQAQDRVGDFSLLDTDGVYFQLSRHGNRQAVVLLSEGAGCNSFTRSVAEFESIDSKYADGADGFEFLLINATGEHNRAALRSQSEAYDNLPLLMDETQLVSEMLGFSTVGEAVVLDPRSLEILYRGSVSDLDRALGEIASGNAVSEASTSSTGCNLTFAARNQHAGNPVSYSQDIAPLLTENCARCHREGGIGLFPMNSHLMIQAWAPLIRNAILTKLMPPGQTDPHIPGTTLLDNRHLSSDQRQKLVHWIDAGAVNDSDADPLVALEWPTTKWALGEPDVVVKLPPQEIPATGHLGLIWVDTGYVFEKDTWLKGATTVPGDRSVVHHTAARVVPPGGTPDMAGGSSMPNWGPGMNERFLGEGTGLFIPEGYRLFLNMHYTPNGTATVDATEYGLYFHEDGFEPTHEIILGGVVLRGGFEIPPHDEDYDIVRTSQPVSQDAYAVTFLPHMHYRGKRVKWTAQYPDGTEEVLFSVPNFDFNWQLYYDLAEPRFIPAGTTFLVEGAYDNSAMNLNNPDPDATVVWGAMDSTEEMFGARVLLKVPVSGDPRARSTSVTVPVTP